MPTEHDDAAVIRQTIQHEDVLRDQRLNWLLALNGFLFAALAFAWAGADSTPLIVILAAVGKWSVSAPLAAMRASKRAIANLAKIAPAEGTGAVPVVALRSEELEKEGGLSRLVPRIYPWRVIPGGIVLTWISVVVVRVVERAEGLSR